jgi:hypothetical protein
MYIIRYDESQQVQVATYTSGLQVASTNRILFSLTQNIQP